MTKLSDSLPDTIVHVPALLQAVAASCGVPWDALRHKGAKPLRLLCKSMRVRALKAVSSYRLKLSHEPSDTEPVLGVAHLLKETQLLHLGVDINVLSGV